MRFYGLEYNFKNITKLYAYPQPHLSDKKVRTYITHGNVTCHNIIFEFSQVEIGVGCIYICIWMETQ